MVRLNGDKASMFLISAGRAFHSRGPATEKALSPNCVLVRWMSYSVVFAERSWRCPGNNEIVVVSVRYEWLVSGSVCPWPWSLDPCLVKFLTIEHRKPNFTKTDLCLYHHFRCLLLWVEQESGSDTVVYIQVMLIHRLSCFMHTSLGLTNLF